MQVADNPACVWNKEWSELRSIGLPGCGGLTEDGEEILEGEEEDGEDEMENGKSRRERQREELYRLLVQHLRRLVQERDDYAHVSRK